VKNVTGLFYVPRAEFEPRTHGDISHNFPFSTRVSPFRNHCENFSLVYACLIQGVLKELRPDKVLPLKSGDELECIAIESKSSKQARFGILCAGKLEDGRIVLFNRNSGLSKAIKPGDRVKGTVVASKPNYVIITPDRIIEHAPDAEQTKALVGSKWDHSLIVSIRREKERQKSPDLDRALQLISKALYGEKTHYILELVQNAEDESATGISFTIHKDKIEVWNNGKAFDQEDVKNICSVRSGKRNKIGFFGIGFKSVFNVTDRPQIISGSYNFMIEDFIYPVPCETEPPSDFDLQKGAWFILPYDFDKHTPEDLEKSMISLDEKILLFLSNIKEITFANTVSDKGWYLEQKELEGGVISLYNSLTGNRTLWKIFSKDLKVPKELQLGDELRQKPEVTSVSIAFPVSEKDELNDVSSEPVYCYLPTKKRTDMPFIIQGDFDPTVGRENIKDNEWNKWLLLQVGELVVEAYQLLRDQKTPFTLLYKYIPSGEEVKEEALKPVYEVIKNGLAECAIAPTEDGRWITPSNVVLDTSNGHLKKLIGDDIRKLKGEDVGYLSSTVGERGRSILLELGAQQIVTDDLLDFLQKVELLRNRADKGPEWFLQLYVYLGKEFYKEKIVPDQSAYEAQLRRLKSSRIILTARNELVAIEDPENLGVVIFYPHRINLDEEYRAFEEGEADFVHHFFQKSTILRKKTKDPELGLLRDKAKEFLDFLGVRLYYDDYTIINDVVCRRLEQPEQLSNDTIIRYSNFVHQNIERYLSLAKSKYQTTRGEEEILQGLREKFTVRVFYLENSHKEEAFAKASETYLSQLYGDSKMESLFEGVPKVLFLSEIYAENGDAKEWSEFFKKIGVWACPRIIETHDEEISYSDPRYKWVSFGDYYGKHVLEGNCISPELEAFFVYTASLPQKEKQKRFELLWKALNEHWNKTYRKVESCYYNWTPISRIHQTKIKNSSFLNQLLTTPWVPASDGTVCEPMKLFRSNKTNHLLLGESRKFLALHGNQVFLRALRIRESPTKEEVLSHLKQLRLEGVQYTKDTLEKFQTIYTFLTETSESEAETEADEIKKIREEFENDELIYIPRKDKEWWCPSKTFWRDHNQIFGKMRGYLSSFYTPETFPTFKKIGIKETAGLEDSIAVLREISEKAEVTDTVKAVINSVYLECERLLVSNDGGMEGISLDELSLLGKREGEGHKFFAIKDLVYADDEQLAKVFANGLKILWLGCSYSEVSHFLRFIKVRPISSIIEIEISPVDITDAPITIVRTIREWQPYLELWLKYKKPKLYPMLVDGLANLGKLDIFEAQKIDLTYKLKGNSLEKTSATDTYYDKNKNALYVSASLDSYSPKLTSEICRMFAFGEVLKEPVLALISTGEDDRKRIEVFEQFGIPKEGLPRLIMEKIEPKQVEEVEEALKTLEKQKSQPLDKQETEPESFKMPITDKIVQIGPLLIDPNDYEPSEITELEVSLPLETLDNVETSKRIVRATNKIDSRTRKRTIKITMSPQLPEDVAFELVKKFEISQNRTVDDTPRNQKNVGYDLSSTDATAKRFIDIKSTKYDSITITIQQSEWRKAELEEDNYYLYVVTGLRAGGSPKLRIIQNPVKNLKPDPPSRINVSKWNHAVKFEVSYDKRVKKGKGTKV